MTHQVDFLFRITSPLAVTYTVGVLAFTAISGDAPSKITNAIVSLSLPAQVCKLYEHES